MAYLRCYRGDKCHCRTASVLERSLVAHGIGQSQATFHHPASICTWKRKRIAVYVVALPAFGYIAPQHVATPNRYHHSSYLQLCRLARFNLGYCHLVGFSEEGDDVWNLHTSCVVHLELVAFVDKEKERKHIRTFELYWRRNENTQLIEVTVVRKHAHIQNKLS